jgi:hypothetical protein
LRAKTLPWRERTPPDAQSCRAADKSMYRVSGSLVAARR